jgi:hypothetical protein
MKAKIFLLRTPETVQFAQNGYRGANLVDKPLVDFIAQDKVTINIRKILCVEKDNDRLLIFYEDIVPGVEKNNDRFADLDV